MTEEATKPDSIEPLFDDPLFDDFFDKGERISQGAENILENGARLRKRLYEKSLVDAGDEYDGMKVTDSYIPPPMQ